MAFPGLLVPLRFNDNAKFQHCLDIFDTAATDGKCEILGKPVLDKTKLQNFPNAIANVCMEGHSDTT